MSHFGNYTGERHEDHRSLSFNNITNDRQENFWVDTKMHRWMQNYIVT